MNRGIPWLVVGTLVLALFALGWILDQVQDRVLLVGTALILLLGTALILYILPNEWKLATLPWSNGSKP
ncbi:MAG: hypothetical protein SNJ75_18430 [Gemmataceae bacterium]